MSRPQKKQNMTAIIRNKKGVILSIGKNSYVKTHPMMFNLAKYTGNKDPKRIYIHAEISAIVKCQNLENAYSIEVYRWSSDSNLYMLSKPCAICMSGIEKTPIKKLIYTGNEGESVVETL